MPKPVRAEVSVTVPFPPEQLWPFVADTDRMDRAAGMPAASYTRQERAEGGEVVTGAYRLLGRPFARWTEHPFEWEWPRRFAVLREYHSGPLRRFYGGSELLPAGAGTRIRSFVEITPRYGLLAPLVRYGLAPVGLGRARHQHRAIAAFLAAQAAAPFPALVRARSPVDADRLANLVRRLQAEGAPPDPLARLQGLLAEAADEDLVGMRPLELAGRWETDARQTLETFLRATVAGMVELHWELLCPNCRGVKATARHLRDLATTAPCPACNRHVIANVDEAIEARFYPAPALRRVALGTYCVGSPVTTLHRVAQATLAPGAIRAWELDLVPGRYYLRSPQSQNSVCFQVEPASQSAVLTVTLDAAGLRAAPDRGRAGPVTLRLRNDAPYPATIALDDAHWSATGATPGQLMTLPVFRDLFSAEALAPGVELAVGCVGLLFTDLAGSTALYERVGEARAFRLVGEHFAVVQAAIEAAGGAVVKTIGDAVMGAFPDGCAALAAGLAIQRGIRALDTGGVVDPARLVKVGVHAGPCFAVTLNRQLDYFGTAVNLTARAQHAARGGEVVATAAVFEEAPAAVVVGLPAEPFETVVKGLGAPVRLYRIDCASSPAVTSVTPEYVPG